MRELNPYRRSVLRKVGNGHEKRERAGGRGEHGSANVVSRGRAETHRRPQRDLCGREGARRATKNRKAAGSRPCPAWPSRVLSRSSQFHSQARTRRRKEARALLRIWWSLRTRE